MENSLPHLSRCNWPPPGMSATSTVSMGGWLLALPVLACRLPATPTCMSEGRLDEAPLRFMLFLSLFQDQSRRKPAWRPLRGDDVQCPARTFFARPRGRSFSVADALPMSSVTRESDRKSVG